MITLLRLRTLSKKVWLWAKKFWWAIALGLLFIIAGLVAMLTKNAAVLAAVVDLLDVLIFQSLIVHSLLQVVLIDQ